jgi:hypothetical protein
MPGSRGVRDTVTTGDAFVRENVSAPVDFIKIDVEKHEGQVIKGLAATIEEFQPIITLEWNNRTTMDYFRRHNIFNEELKGYHRLAMYSRWSRDLWPEIFGKMRRRMGKILAKPGYDCYLSAFEADKVTDSVVLIPPRLTALIEPAQAAHPPSHGAGRGLSPQVVKAVQIPQLEVLDEGVGHGHY